MNTFLRFAVAAMMLAGIYGFADLIHDIQCGTLISYERHTPGPAAQTTKQSPGEIAFGLKGLPAAIYRSGTKKTLLQNKIATLEKEEKPIILVSDLSVRSFGRSIVSLPPQVIHFDDECILSAVVPDSIKKRPETDSHKN